MNPKEREQKISYVKGQIDVVKSYILYWHASATTGAATMRDISRGTVPTDTSEVWSSNAEYKQLSDKEKIQDALNTMKTHIHRLSDLNDTLYELLGMGK